MSLYTFRPFISPATGIMTATQVTTATASATQKFLGARMKIKCLTNPCYIRFVKTAAEAVTTSNGYYMAVGDEVDMISSEGARFLAHIRSGGSDGALSIMWGEGE